MARYSCEYRRAWLDAASLVQVNTGDASVLPTGSAPLPPPTTAVQAPQPTVPAVVAVEPTTPQGTSGTLVLEDTAFHGGLRNGGGSIYGGRTSTWVYGQGSGFSTMSASFNVRQVAAGNATLTIVGMDSEDPAKTPMRVAVNNSVLYEGASPFPNDDIPLQSGSSGDRLS